MDKFADIQAFVAVVETGSFSAAAERLDATKSSMSRRISGLESRLGVKLLNRTTRRLNLTDGGRDFFERAVRILADLQEAEQAISEADCALRGRIRVAAPLSFGLLHLAPAVNAFAEQHPEVRVDLDLNDRQVSLVEEGFDMAVRIGRLADSSLVARRLCTIRRVAVASPDYLQRTGLPEQPKDLETHAGLRYTNLSRQEFWRFKTTEGRDLSPDVPDRLTANNGELLTQAAVDGLGVTVQPSFIVHRALAAGHLQRILAQYDTPSAAMYAVFPPGRYLSRRVRVLVDFLAERFGREPYWDLDLKAG
jgi:DNA-binding transcriptional LysR family regulator